MPDLPSGTITFLFTDIEGSTRLLRENRPSYGRILVEHGEILRAAFEKHGGREIDTQAPIPRAGFTTIHAPTSDALLDASGLWITDTIEGKVWRIRTPQGSIQDTIPVGPGALPIASGGGSVWVANRGDGTVSRIDPRTDGVTETIKVADHVSGIAVAAGSVWVTVP
jgi:YVTN family beta-propeller protein